MKKWLCSTLFFCANVVFCGDVMSQKMETQQQLNEKISSGGIYQHYSGKKYKVLSIGRCTESESLEPYVIYQALYVDPVFGENQIWIRPLSMFLEKIMINGVQKQRFVKID